LIAAWIAAACEQVEAITGRALLAQTWELRVHDFPSSGRGLELPVAPLLGVGSVTYMSPDGVLTALPPEAYQVVQPAGPTAQPGAVFP
ncbi:hypothetical protein ABTC46_18465, partial [Acinetobacter baumannii]